MSQGLEIVGCVSHSCNCGNGGQQYCEAGGAAWRTARRKIATFFTVSGCVREPVVFVLFGDCLDIPSK